MMIRRTFDPFADFDRINEMVEKIMGTPAKETSQSLPLDVMEKDNALILRAPLPGLSNEQVDIALENRVLTIKTQAVDEQDFADARIYRREVSTSAQTRSIRLPEGLDLEKISADLTNGLLIVRIPRIRAEQPRSIQIGVGSQAQQLPIETEVQA